MKRAHNTARRIVIDTTTMQTSQAWEYLFAGSSPTSTPKPYRPGIVKGVFDIFAYGTDKDKFWPRHVWSGYAPTSSSAASVMRQGGLCMGGKCNALLWGTAIATAVLMYTCSYMESWS
jgi:hypothetical protein